MYNCGQDARQTGGYGVITVHSIITMCRFRISVVNRERWPTYKDGQSHTFYSTAQNTLIFYLIN